jgi:hypothetical protein
MGIEDEVRSLRQMLSPSSPGQHNVENNEVDAFTVEDSIHVDSRTDEARRKSAVLQHVSQQARDLAIIFDAENTGVCDRGSDG